MSDSRFDFLSSLEGWIIGFFTAAATVFGWFNGKLKGLHTRIDQSNDKIEKLQAETAMNRASLMVQEAHHQANIVRLGRIEDECTKQTDMLTQLLRGKHGL
jgi:hypothetical protein